MSKIVKLSILIFISIPIFSQTNNIVDTSTVFLNGQKYYLVPTYSKNGEMYQPPKITDETLEEIKYVQKLVVVEDEHWMDCHIKCIVSGFLINGLKEGIWDAKDKNGKYLYSIVYHRDVKIAIIYLKKKNKKKNNKIYFIKEFPIFVENENDVIHLTYVSSFMQFNKRGKPIKKASMVYEPSDYLRAYKIIDHGDYKQFQIRNNMEYYFEKY